MQGLDHRAQPAPSADADLLAFARGHSEAAASIQRAVLAVLDAQSPGALALTVTRDWPWILSVDRVALAWARQGAGMVAENGGRRPIEARLVARMASLDRETQVRAVARGHPLFGAHAGEIRAEALIRLNAGGGAGLLILGDRAGIAAETPAAARLLCFLGRATSAMLARWPLPHAS